jgi:hypothetical protein
MKRITISIALLIALLCSCKEAIDVYLGVPLQPRFDSGTFQPGLNIFGVIRTDSTSLYNNSFIIVQKVTPAVGDSSGFEIDTAVVWVSRIDSYLSDSVCEFTLTNNDSTFRETSYRPNCNFQPKPGDILLAECIYEDLPVLYAKTVIPNKAVSNSSTVNYNNNSVELELLPDTTYFMLDVFVYASSQIIGYQRLPANEDTNINVTISSIFSQPDSVVVYSYDYNLAVYYLTSNTSLNFNKYRKSFSTVENGYGVFGSINKNVFLP